MDDLDRAFEHEDMVRRIGLAAARSHRSGLQACGECHACGEELEPGRLFCDADCAQDYERQRRLRQQNRG